MSRILTLSVEVPDDTSLRDVAQGVRESFERQFPYGDDADKGRVRISSRSEAVGGWTIDEVSDTDEAVSIPWPTAEGQTALADLVSVAAEASGIRVGVLVGANLADPDEPPVDGFASLLISRERAEKIGRALLAWSLR